MLKEVIQEIAPENIETVEELMDFLKEACEKTMRKRGNGRKKEVHWWNENINNFRKECIKKRRKYTRCKRWASVERCNSLYNEYRVARMNMNLEIGKSKKKCWNIICEALKKDIWGLAYKILTKKIGKKSPSLPPHIRESAINKLFPNHPVVQWNYSGDRGPRITMDEMLEALLMAKINKAPGPDGIPTKLIKEVILTNTDLVLKVLNSLIEMGEFPKIWKCAKVVLLEKPKKNKEDETSYRPICLLNTMGKLYEGILNQRLIKEIGGLMHNLLFLTFFWGLGKIGFLNKVLIGTY